MTLSPHAVTTTVKRWTVCVAAITLLVAWTATPAQPWGCEGHETVALIAKKHLTPHALQMVTQTLQPLPIDPHLARFCHPAANLDVMANVATWADDEREVNRATEDWHFLDIPRDAQRSEVSSFCPTGGCVVTAIHDQLAVLQNVTADATARGEALMYIIHLVGDIHQPLHCTTNGDRGANCVPVNYFNTKPTGNGSEYKPNLHATWDSNIITRIPNNTDPGHFADMLDAKFQPQVASWQQAGINYEDWAWESHQAAEQTAYGKLSKAISIAPRTPQIANCTQNNNVGKRMLKLHEKIGQTYQDAAAPVIEEQLAKAGIRLAMVLNQVWP